MKSQFKTPAQIMVEVGEQQRLSSDGIIVYWQARNSGADHQDALDAVQAMFGEEALSGGYA